LSNGRENVHGRLWGLRKENMSIRPTAICHEIWWDGSDEWVAPSLQIAMAGVNSTSHPPTHRECGVTVGLGAEAGGES